MGIPLESCNERSTSWALHTNNSPQTTSQGGFTNLVGKSLRWVVYDHRLGEISPEDIKVFDVVALYAYAVFAKQSVPEIPEERHFELKAHLKHLTTWESRHTFVPITPTHYEWKRKHAASVECNLNVIHFLCFFIWEGTDLTSCFLGSRMFSSLSAYTFLEAVKRIICE